MTGSATSPDFPLAHALPSNSALQGGGDAFVSKLSFDARTATLSLAYSTYLGGSSFDFGSRHRGGHSGQAPYVVGVTNLADFPLAHSLPTSAPPAGVKAPSWPKNWNGTVRGQGSRC